MISAELLGGVYLADEILTDFFPIPKTSRFLQTYTTNSSPNCWLNVPAARESKTLPEFAKDIHLDILFCFANSLATSVVKTLTSFSLSVKCSRISQSFAKDVSLARLFNAPALPESIKKEYSKECSFCIYAVTHQVNVETPKGVFLLVGY